MRKRFLIAEDDPKLAETIARTVSTVAPCIIARGASDAIARSERERWLGAIVDVRLTDGTGFDVLASIRANDRMMPALVLTGMVEPDVIHRSYELDATFVCKPMRRDSLIRFAQFAWVENSGAPPALSKAIRDIASAHQLSASEALILTRAVQGYQRDAIIEERGVSANTHRSQVSSLLQKLGATSLSEAANRVLREMLAESMMPPL